MDIKLNSSIHNRFDIEVIDARSGEVKQKAQAENVVLDQLWTSNAYLGNWADYLHYGSGSGTPSASDTELFSYVGRRSMGPVNTTADRVNGIASRRWKVTFSENEAVGVTFTEVGVGSSSLLYTHAMLQDMNGNPISITKTNTDILNIYSTIFMHCSDTEHIIPVGIARNICTGAGGGSSNYNVRLLKGVNDLYRITAVMGSTILPAAGKKGTFSIARIPVDSCNAGGIYHIGLSTSGYTEDEIIIPVSSFYAGDDIVGEAIGTGDGTNTNFATQFDFPENAEIFVDGVKQNSGVTVKRMTGELTTSAVVYLTGIDGNSTSDNIMLKDTGSSSYSSTQIRLYAGIIKNENYIRGFDRLYLESGMKVYGSNDFITWSLIAETSGYCNLDVTTGHYLYYKVEGESTVRFYKEADDNYNIVFDNPPANGSVITANYHTPCIAKDANHVLDMSFTLQFGEYVE